MKVGDYVRTKSGIIGKIQSKNYIGYSDWLIDTLYYSDDEIIDDWTCGIKEYDVIKSSPRIIDLIEVGDYVNGRKVYQVGYNFQDDLVLKMSINKDGTLNNYEDFIYEENIKSIVTKEQFEQMEYKVGE